MKKGIFIALFAAASLAAFSQSAPSFDESLQKTINDMKPTFGFKAGYNVAMLNGSSSTNFSPNAKNGFTAAAFFSPGARPGLGYRTEIVFSRQGFEFTANGKTSGVTNDYVYMPHFTTFGVGRFLQFQLGGQLGYLLKSSKATPESKSQDITSFSSRLDYGAAGGVEVYPIKHLILGGRYNISFGNAYKRMTEQSSTTPSPFPLPFNPDEVKGKNAVINFFVGFRF